jgi:dTDP-4-amino-4,6-dideoxygalactose transaminase
LYQAALKGCATHGDGPEGRATHGDGPEGRATHGDGPEGRATHGDGPEGRATHGYAHEPSRSPCDLARLLYFIAHMHTNPLVGRMRAEDRLAIDGGTPVRAAPLPLSLPLTGPAEADAVADAVRRGWLTGNGPACRRAEDALARILGVPALFMTSCTSALETSVRLCGVAAGDEVLCPSFTFVSTANAVVRAGARPVFVDIDPDTLNVDPAALEGAVTARTRAILVVHYAGRACDMGSILALADRHGLRVIEDAAHALGGQWQGRLLGTVGDFGCFSFHGTKDVVCGEGGALVCRSEADRRAAEIFREKGTNRAAFLRGEVDRYTWIGEGSSFVASDVLAALLTVQLDRLPAILARKRALADRLTSMLEPLEPAVRLPREWPGILSTWHIYPVLVDPATRDAEIRALQAEGIGAAFHYVPLHSSPFGRERLGGRADDLPHTARVSASLIRLPLFAAMSDDDLEDVAVATLKVLGRP